MVRIKLPHLVQDIDRHGNVRSYVRLREKPKIRIRGVVGSPEFMSAYHAALGGDSENKRRQYRRADKGSFGYVCLAYYDSPIFKRLDQSTQAWRRRALDRICEQHADKPIGQLQPRHIRNLRDEVAATPAIANERLKALRALLAENL
jgi:hypothetical protein